MTITEVMDPLLRPRSGTSAKSLLVTLLGEFVLKHGGSVWTRTLVDGLAMLGIEERNARQAVARLKNQQIVEVEHHGRMARWNLTESGEQLLTIGARRIYRFGLRSEEWDGRWLVVHCSIPEAQRAKRHHFHTRLAFEGFGFIAPTVAVSPHPESEEAANAVITSLDLVDSAVVLRAEAGTMVPDAAILARTWDLGDLASEYEAFIAEVERCRPRGDAQAFEAAVQLVHRWRRFPFTDPELPAELLPDKWIGHRARWLFDQRHTEWAGAANDWFAAAEASFDSDS